MSLLFKDRRDAGKKLAETILAPWLVDRIDILVLALPRGGVPVAFEVARALRAPLDLVLTSKLSVAEGTEKIIGAVALPDVCVLNREAVQENAITQALIDEAVGRETEILKRRNRLYRGNRQPAYLGRRIVILVDDGALTGSHMHAAISAVAAQRPLQIIVALPVASAESVELLSQHADDVICMHRPANFTSIGQAYKDYSPTTDKEVLSLLEEARNCGKGRVTFWQRA